MSDAFVLLAHGSRDPAWVAPFDRIAARVREARPDAGDVALAYLEHAQPDLAGAVDGVVARGARRVRVVPLFLGVGGHVRKDVPALVEAARARHPGIEIAVTASLGESDAVLDAVAAWIAGQAAA
jgi:sirohydrochlorin cobaltochelatase